MSPWKPRDKPGAARAYLFFLGRGTSSKRSGAVMACFWIDFQAKPSNLDPIRAIFDDLDPNRHFGRDLDQARDWPGRPGPAHPLFCLTKKKWVGQGPLGQSLVWPSPAQNVGSGPNHQKPLKSDPESTARPENQTTSMPGPLWSVSGRSRDAAKRKLKWLAEPP